MLPVAALFILAVEATLAPGIERHQLENGLTVLLHPIPDAGAVSVHTQYSAGCFDNPVGAAQATRVLATILAEIEPAEEGPRESWRGLLQEGRVSTGFDGQRARFECVIDASELETVLRVEGQRLSGAPVDPESCERLLAEQVQAFEGPGRQTSELDLALAALAQVWRFDQRELSWTQELRALTPATLDELSRRLYRPDQATLLIMGEFEPKRALMLVRRRIGATVPPGPGSSNTAGSGLMPLDWSAVPRQATMHWDAGFAAVCIASSLPQNPSDALLLSLYGKELERRLLADGELAGLARSLMADGLAAGIDVRPGLVIAIAAEGVTAAELEPHLLAALQAAIEELPSPDALLRLRGRAQRLARTSDLLTADSMAAERVRLEASGQTPEQALRNVMNANAREVARVERLLGRSTTHASDGASKPALRRLDEVTPQALHSLLRENFSERQRRRTLLERLVPVDPAADDGH